MNIISDNKLKKNLNRKDIRQKKLKRLAKQLLSNIYKRKKQNINKVK